MLQKIHILLYDLLVRTNLFNILLWQNTLEDYLQFYASALNSCPQGTVIDAPCGTIPHSYKLYAADHSHSFILADLSQQALNIAVKRLTNAGADLQQFRFIKANFFNLPLEPNTADIFICAGFLHLFSDSAQIMRILSQIKRILKPNAFAHFLILVADKPLPAFFQHLLYLLRQIGKPHKSQFYINLIRNSQFHIVSVKNKGGMLFLTAKKQ